MAFFIFMASRMTTVCPLLIRSPCLTSTERIFPGMGAVRAPTMCPSVEGRGTGGGEEEAGNGAAGRAAGVVCGEGCTASRARAISGEIRASVRSSSPERRTSYSCPSTSTRYRSAVTSCTSMT